MRLVKVIITRHLTRCRQSVPCQSRSVGVLQKNTQLIVSANNIYQISNGGGNLNDSILPASSFIAQSALYSGQGRFNKISRFMAALLSLACTFPSPIHWLLLGDDDGNTDALLLSCLPKSNGSIETEREGGGGRGHRIPLRNCATSQFLFNYPIERKKKAIVQVWPHLSYSRRVRIVLNSVVVAPLGIFILFFS